MGLLRADEIREHCGVFAVVGHPKASELCYYGLYALQHRGQESAGMAVRNGSRIQTRKGMGLVSDVFSREDVMRLEGSSAVAHVRYSNIGDEGGIEDAQPIAVKMWQGQMSFAHNGNLINAARLRTRLEQGGSIFQTTSDCEVIPHLMAKSGLKDPVKALIESLPALRGAYSLCVLTPNGIIAAKDPNGFRPLCLGRLGGHISYVLRLVRWTLLVQSLSANLPQEKQYSSKRWSTWIQAPRVPGNLCGIAWATTQAKLTQTFAFSNSYISPGLTRTYTASMCMQPGKLLEGDLP